MTKKKKPDNIVFPKGMSESEVLETIEKVVNNIAHKFRFGYYDLDDVKQEATIRALLALEKYDTSKPLENFLYTHIKNRMCNLKRDKYERIDKPCNNCPFNAYIKKTDECTEYEDKLDCKLYYGWVKRNRSKKNLVDAIPIGSVRHDENESNMKTKDDTEIVANKEIVAIIDENIPVSLRHDWLRMKFGIKISKSNRLKLQQAIIKIFEERNINVEEIF